MNSLISIPMILASVAGEGREPVPTSPDIFPPFVAAHLADDPRPEIRRSSPIALDPAALRAELIAKQGTGELLTVPLFDGDSSSWRVRSVETTAQGQLVAFAEPSDVPSLAMTCVVSERYLQIDMWTPRGTYSIRPRGEGVLELVELDPEFVTGCALEDAIVRPGSVAAARPSGIAARPTVTTDAPMTTPVVEVLFLFTPPAALAAGGTSQALSGAALSAVSSVNMAFTNSNVVASLSVVAAVELPGPDPEPTNFGAGSFATLVEMLANPTDGLIDDAQVLRDAFKADLVVMVVSQNEGNGLLAGITYRQMLHATDLDGQNAFAVVDDGLMISSFVLAHEVGHLMGASHERPPSTNGHLGQGPSGAFPWAHGYAWLSVGPNGMTQLWRTIMVPGSFGGTRIQYYSNPDVLWPLNPTVSYLTGIGPNTVGAIPAEYASNADVLSATAPVVSRFR